MLVGMMFKAIMDAVAEDQRRIEGILETERLRVEESLRAAAAARKARDEADDKGDTEDIEPRCASTCYALRLCFFYHGAQNTKM